MIACHLCWTLLLERDPDSWMITVWCVFLLTTVYHVDICRLPWKRVPPRGTGCLVRPALETWSAYPGTLVVKFILEHNPWIELCRALYNMFGKAALQLKNKFGWKVERKQRLVTETMLSLLCKYRTRCNGQSKRKWSVGLCNFSRRATIGELGRTSTVLFAVSCWAASVLLSMTRTVTQSGLIVLKQSAHAV